MRILSLTLEKFNRMTLSGSSYFHITFTNNLQIILGTNGCGKSSLLGELTPLPAESSNYYPGGSKTIVILEKGITYTLTSTFSGGSHHSFKCGDEEYNKGGTAMVQKELVKEYFKITPEIHDLMTGLESFHSMKPQRRREWFVMMSVVNYDYALSMYSRLKDNHRDILGASKLAKKRLVIEVSKIMSEEEEAKLQLEVDAIHSELSILMSRTAPIDRSVFDLENDLNSSYKELENLSSTLLKMKIIAPYGIYPYGEQESEFRDEWGVVRKKPFSTVSEIEEAITITREKQVSVETMLDSAMKEHARLTEVIAVLDKTGKEDLAALQTKISNLTSCQAELLKKRILSIENIDVLNSKKALDAIYNEIETILLTIPDNSDRKYTTANLNSLNESLARMRIEKVKLESSLLRLGDQRVHLEKHKQEGLISCPKCFHNWVPGYNEEVYTGVLTNIETATRDLGVLLKRIEDSENLSKEFDIYMSLYRQYILLTTSTSVLKPLWNHIAENGYIADAPRKALTALNSFKLDLEVEVEVSKIGLEINEVLQTIKSVETVGDANLEDCRVKLDSVVLDVERYTSIVRDTKTKLNTLSTYRKQIIEALNLRDKISSLLNHQESVNASIVEAVRLETINHCVRQLQHRLAVKQELLTNARMQKTVVENIEEQITTLSKEEEVVKCLMQELSPTDGLIAEGLLGFIRSYVNQMNKIISRIWTYDLKIMDCGISDETGTELDYKFPMLVEANNRPVPDVKFGSSGMCEVINLAFRSVAMPYLGLTNAPLYCDEFAARMDMSHRTTAMQAIKDLMETGNYSQLFLISHNYESHGCFSAAEITVIDGRNVVLPDRYNEHLVLR